MIENTLRWWIVSERGWRLGGRSGEIRQTLDDSAGRRAKDLTAGLRIWPSPIELGRSRCRSSDVLGGCHGLKRARHGVDENTNRAASRPHVFDFPAGQPIVNRAPTHPDELTCLHDRNRFAFH